MLVVARRSDARRAAALGWLTGFIANLVIFFWLWKTFFAAGLGWEITGAAWIALAAILAIYFAGFVFAVRLLSTSWWTPLIAGAIWVVLESIRSTILSGFPWALLSHTQAYRASTIQISSITGAAGVSFVVAMVNAALAGALSARGLSRRKRMRLAAPACAVAFAVAAFGWVRLRSHGPEPIRTVKVALLQGNIDQYQKWDALYEQQIKTRYRDLAARAAAGKPDLVVWPESAVPGWFPIEPVVERWVRSVVGIGEADHLVGSITRRDGKEFNSLFLIHPDRSDVQVYDKQHLVPFGEYVPIGWLFKRAVPYLGKMGEFHSGSLPVVFDWEGLKIAANICYEAVFPRLVRRTAMDANIIVNVTNDGWFLDTAAPEQHYVTNIFRAVETGRPVLRAANTGISAVIDSRGRELVRSPLLVSGVYEAVVPVPPANARTLFLRKGTAFGVVCWLVALGAALVIWRQRRL